MFLFRGRLVRLGVLGRHEPAVFRIAVIRGTFFLAHGRAWVDRNDPAKCDLGTLVDRFKAKLCAIHRKGNTPMQMAIDVHALKLGQLGDLPPGSLFHAVFPARNAYPLWLRVDVALSDGTLVPGAMELDGAHPLTVRLMQNSDWLQTRTVPIPYERLEVRFDPARPMVGRRREPGELAISADEAFMTVDLLQSWGHLSLSRMTVVPELPADKVVCFVPWRLVAIDSQGQARTIIEVTES